MNNLVNRLEFILDENINAYFYPNENLFLIGPITPEFENKFIKKQYRKWPFYGIKYNPTNDNDVYVEMDTILKYCTQKTQRYFSEVKYNALTQQGYI